jgi:Integrase core domain
MKKWLRAQPTQPATIADLQMLLDTFADQYNHRRPHRSLPHRATPAMIYTSRPKATPGDRTDDTHERIRRDRVDKAGKITLRHDGTLYSIGIGRTHARTRVIVLVQDLDIRIIDATTGELIRELTLDTTKRYQSTGRLPGPTTR